jgi:hypothetical protein
VEDRDAHFQAGIDVRQRLAVGVVEVAGQAIDAEGADRRSITACVLRGVATPMVSAMSISSQPRSRMRPTTSATADSGTSP